MARGYPDFFGPSSFAPFGVHGQHAEETPIVGAGFTMPVFTITGRYILTGGYIIITDDDSAGGSALFLWIDNTAMVFGGFSDMMDRQITPVNQFPVYLTDYSPAENRYAFSIDGGYAFGVNWSLQYLNGGGVNSTVQGRLWLQSIL